MILFLFFFILWLQQPWRGIDSGYPFKREQTMLLSHTVLSEKKKKKTLNDFTIVIPMFNVIWIVW